MKRGVCNSLCAIMRRVPLPVVVPSRQQGCFLPCCSNGLLFLLFEETEIYTAVCNVAEEVWVAAEIVILAVLEYENTILVQHIALQYEVGYGGEVFQGIGRVGEYQIVAAVAAAYVAENIVAHKLPAFVVERCGTFLQV